MENVLTKWEDKLLEKLMEVFYKQKNNKREKLGFFIVEIVFNFFIVSLFLSDLDIIGQKIVYGALVLFSILFFYVKIIRISKREEFIKNNLKEVVERIKNFKDYQNGNADFNFKKEIIEKKITSIEKSIEKNIKILTKVSNLAKYLSLSPINFNYFHHEFIIHMTAMGNLLNKLKEFRSENKI